MATKKQTAKVNNSSLTEKIYRVSVFGVCKWNDEDGKNKVGIDHSDNYRATSEEEAMGMAFKNVGKKYPQYNIQFELTHIAVINPLT